MTPGFQHRFAGLHCLSDSSILIICKSTSELCDEQNKNESGAKEKKRKSVVLEWWIKMKAENFVHEGIADSFPYVNATWRIERNITCILLLICIHRVHSLYETVIEKRLKCKTIIYVVKDFVSQLNPYGPWRIFFYAKCTPYTLTHTQARFIESNLQ